MNPTEEDLPQKIRLIDPESRNFSKERSGQSVASVDSDQDQIFPAERKGRNPIFQILSVTLPTAMALSKGEKMVSKAAGRIDR